MHPPLAVFLAERPLLPLLLASILAVMVHPAFAADPIAPSPAESSSRLAAAFAEPVSLGLALQERQRLQIAGDWATFVVDEESQGADLNGDGDAADPVLHLLNLRTGAVTNVGLSPQWHRLYPNLVTVAVGEAYHGVDFDGDGVIHGEVLFTLEPGQAPGTPAPRNLRRSVERLELVGTRLFFVVREHFAYTGDLNGDGDANDEVLFRWTLGETEAKNLRLAVGALARRTEVQLPGLGRPGLAVSVSERNQFATDLNGDGDDHDEVLFTCLAPCDEWVNRRLAVDGGQFSFLGTHDHAFDYVRELSQGASDLNGDGDIDDFVPHAIALAGGGASSSGPQTSGLYTSGLSTSGLYTSGLYTSGLYSSQLCRGSSGVPVTDRRLAVFFTSETCNGGVDLNDNGTVDDQLAAVLDLASGVTSILPPALTNPSAQARGGAVAVTSGLDGTYLWSRERPAPLFLGPRSGVQLMKSWVAVTQDEDSLEVDLNGDGDRVDRVWAYLRPDEGIVSLGLAARPSEGGVEGPTGELLVWVPEVSQGGIDLNQDGDAVDQVLHLLHPPTALGGPRVENLGIALDFLQTDVLALGARAILVSVHEFYGGTGDLNGDGDTQDSILHLLWRPPVL